MKVNRYARAYAGGFPDAWAWASIGDTVWSAKAEANNECFAFGDRCYKALAFMEQR